MISQVSKGLINDDFIKDRVTLKVFCDYEDGYITCKMYNDGRIVTFTGNDIDGSYIEKEMDIDFVNEIKANLW